MHRRPIWKSGLCRSSVLLLAFGGCGFSVTPLWQDDFPVVSEHQLYQLNSRERAQFLSSYSDTRILVATDMGQPPRGLIAARLSAPADRWLVDRPQDDKPLRILLEDRQADPGFAVILPDNGGLVIPVGEYGGGSRLLRYRAGRSDDWQLPHTDTPIIQLFGSAWIPDLGCFYLMGVEGDLSVRLWEIRLDRSGDEPVFQEKWRILGGPPDVLAKDGCGKLFWSATDRALYVIGARRKADQCFPQSPYRTLAYDDQFHPSYVIRIDPEHLNWAVITPGDAIHGVSEQGLVYSQYDSCAMSGLGISTVRLRAIPGGQETLLLRVRGHIGSGAFSPDGKYLLFPNSGFLHDPLFVDYGPTIWLVWALDSRKGFVVDASNMTSVVLAWASSKDMPSGGTEEADE